MEHIPALSKACRTRLQTVGRHSIFLVMLGLLFLVPTALVRAGPSVSREYQIKAAFLYNFTKYVQWPESRFQNADTPITIAVFDTQPFGDELANAVRGRLVNGRPIVVKVITNVEEAATAQVFFVGAKNEHRLGNSLQALHRAGVLTVGETPKFATQGGIITFTLEVDKVRFEINQLTGEQAGLKISAQLLKLATHVRR